MRRLLYILGFIIVASSIFLVFNIQNNRSENKDINADLLRADSLMFIKPDSSLAILETMKHKVFADPHNNAFQALLLVQARSRNYIKAENDSLIKVALDYYATSSDQIRKAWTYLYAADVYEDMGEKDTALFYIQKTATVSTNVADYRLQCYLYYNWGRLIQNEKPYVESINKMLESEKYARRLNDTTLIISRLLDIAWSYMYQKDYNEASISLRIAILHAKQAKLYSYYTLIYQQYALISYFNKEYHQSLQYSDTTLHYIHSASDPLRIYSFRGDVFFKLGQIDSARYYIEKGKDNQNFFTRANYQDQMSLLEEARGNYKSALKYRAEYAKLLDSIYIEEDNNKVMEFQKKYDFSTIKAEKDKLKIDNQQKNIYLLSFIIAFLCVAIAVYYYLSYTRKKIDNMLTAKDKLLSQAISDVQKKNNELIMKQEQFQEKEFDMLNMLSYKDNERSMLQQEQRNLRESIFKTNNVVKKIEKIKEFTAKEKVKTSASLPLSDQELESLIDSVNFCYNRFVERLIEKYEDLTKEDLCLCCLLRMGVTNQNIITLLNTTDSTLKKRKYRLKNDKLKVPHDFETLEIFFYVKPHVMQSINNLYLIYNRLSA